jgi:AcrR family transcriptional regulator
MRTPTAQRPRRRRSAEPKGEILVAAARAIAEHGYHGMSMRDLARATGKALASFYSHYASKEDVLFELQTGAFETLIATVERALEAVEDPVGRLYVFIHNHVRYVAEHDDVMRVLVHEASALPPPRRRTVRALKERYFRIGRKIVESVLWEGCGREGARGAALAGAEVERATYCVFGMLNWVYGWYRPERHGSPAEVAHTIHRLALCGMVARCPHRPLQDAMDRFLEKLDAPPLIPRVPGATP